MRRIAALILLLLVIVGCRSDPVIPGPAPAPVVDDVSDDSLSRPEVGRTPVRVRCQPIYGNWCGKNYPASHITGVEPEPVDVWDAACMVHDKCYESRTSKSVCDAEFSDRVEELGGQGVPAPRQLINAYNFFKESLPYRSIRITGEDIVNAMTLSCAGGDGTPAYFCDVGLGRHNCQITMGFRGEGEPCFCYFPVGIRDPWGGVFVPPGARPMGYMTTADDFVSPWDEYSYEIEEELDEFEEELDEFYDWDGFNKIGR